MTMYLSCSTSCKAMDPKPRFRNLGPENAEYMKSIEHGSNPPHQDQLSLETPVALFPELGMQMCVSPSKLLRRVKIVDVSNWSKPLAKG